MLQGPSLPSLRSVSGNAYAATGRRTISASARWERAPAGWCSAWFRRGGGPGGLHVNSTMASPRSWRRMARCNGRPKQVRSSEEETNRARPRFRPPSFISHTPAHPPSGATAAIHDQRSAGQLSVDRRVFEVALIPFGLLSSREEHDRAEARSWPGPISAGSRGSATTRV